MFGAEFQTALQAEMIQIQKRSFKLPFNNFPQEIKSHIIGFVSPVVQDLKNIRLVSHNLAETAAPFLFRELLLTPWTIGRFRDQRSVQTIQPHVRDLVCYDAVFPLVTLDAWTHAYREYEWLPLVLTPGQENEMLTRYNRYHVLYKQQERNFKEMRDGQAVGELIDCIMPTIRSLRGMQLVISEEPGLSTTRRTVPYRTLKVESKIWRDLRNLGYGNFGQHPSHLLPSPFMRFIIDATVRSEVRLKRLAANSMSYYSHPCFGLGGLKVEKRLAVVELFKSLVNFDLESHLCCNKCDHNASLVLLQECLSAAENLEDLSIQFWHYEPFPGDNPDILAHLSLSTRKLKKLRLHRIYTTASSVLLLLLEHYKTLENLEFDHMSLCVSDTHEYQDDLKVIIQTLATELHIDWTYVECVHENGWSSSSSYRYISFNTPQSPWDGERINTLDINDFCEELSKLQIDPIALTYLGLKAVRKRWDGLGNVEG
ncbi:MAG: hypothetical protein Q9226_005751, partial [Calogaya cf. arnoldii]